MNRPLETKTVPKPKHKLELHANDYKTLLDASYTMGNKEAQKLVRPLGYKLDRQLSNVKHRIFKDKYDDVIVAFQGTKPTRVRDLVSDAALLFGLESYDPRFRDAQRTMNRVREKYKGKNIVSIGDSLGGSLAEYSGKKADQIITHNKGVGYSGIGKVIPKKQTDIRSAA